MNLEQSLHDFQSRLHEIGSSLSLPAEDGLQSLLDRALSALENESPLYRPKDDSSRPGGLLDFSSGRLPVVIVPDIHARADFLLRLADSRLTETGETVLELLDKEAVTVVCVGDAVHSESRAYSRWIEGYRDWEAGVYAGPAMQKEMAENFSTLEIIMEMKIRFPGHFHFLKGNHENVLNETEHGNFAFRKFVQEGSMCRDFIRQVYGDVILHLISLWEKSLPVCAVFSDFGVSHAEPREAYPRRRIINCHAEGNEDVIAGLTWTRNDEADADSVQGLIQELIPGSARKGAAWFGGHRPVQECSRYNLRQNGKFLQLHNPEEMNVALVVPGTQFDPETDIKSV
ncbi:MAG: metallophosphoesterase [Treponema sp.]|nr:metallophosphoesterase [Treponema sp.]